MRSHTGSCPLEATLRYLNQTSTIKRMGDFYLLLMLSSILLVTLGNECITDEFRIS